MGSAPGGQAPQGVGPEACPLPHALHAVPAAAALHGGAAQRLL
eukprot:CAMPEP_0202367198 /NCGR_PEP_ID=MMETSP1126-20121109/17510_1 /ASSEMBLY_ACC=CAM_ASM_000457 /TAXON_ID=3047 /ORGANISM="Dunaliella tertiolecta, Strain CCMP1320" /LENGTH=42 /DNA_ID= /DNA_START= /DNA_END= /DNA_ORIENTATION=